MRMNQVKIAYPATPVIPAAALKDEIWFLNIKTVVQKNSEFRYRQNKRQDNISDTMAT